MSESGSRSTIFVVCSLTHCGPMSVTLHAAEFEWGVGEWVRPLVVAAAGRLRSGFAT